MQKPAKRPMLVASLFLAGVSVMGCGVGESPTDATKEEFCAIQTDYST